MPLEKPSRELFVGEIISQTFQLYTTRFILFFLPFLVAGLITGIFSSALFLYLPLPPSPPPSASPTVVFQWLGDFFRALLVIVVLGGIVSWIINSIATGMAVKSASDIMEKGGGTLQESLSSVMSRLASLLVASLITGILVFIGFLLFVVPGIILMIMFSLIVPAIIIEQKGPFESLGRSSKLVSHRWLNTFAVLLIAGLIVGVISGIASVIVFPFGFVGFTPSPFEFSSTLALRILVSSVVTSLVSPILPIATTLLYYSMLAKEAGQLPPPPPPV